MTITSCLNWLFWRRKPQSTQRSDHLRKLELADDESHKSAGKHDLRSTTLNEIAKRIASQFEVSQNEIQQATNAFIEQLNDGLTKPGCSIEQLPSFIEQFPSGNEKGTYLAVDLGGTNVRVCLVTFNGDRTHTVAQRKAVIPTHLMTLPSSMELFQWLATTVRDVLQELTAESVVKEEPVTEMGFTFSHAIQHEAIDRGTLVRWSKGFRLDDAVGQNICALLQNAFNDLGILLKVTAIINDTVGTLLTTMYTSPNPSATILGAVFGTGTNGAYVEQRSKITKLPVSTSGSMIVNTEWGNFDQQLRILPSTYFDRQLDSASVNPGIELFEKRVSGMYLGELLRLAVLELHGGASSGYPDFLHCPHHSKLFELHSIDSSFLSELQNDETPDLGPSRSNIKQWLGVSQVDIELAEAIKMVAKEIGRRSARLSAVAVGAVLLHTGILSESALDEKVVIGVDGSLIELYPGYMEEIRATLGDIRGIGEAGEKRLEIVVTKDGSAVGAALAAHLAAINRME